MMIIQYCSDLHLELPENNRYINRHPLQAKGEILILAGDILPFALDHHKYAFFDVVSERFKAVYWLPGNHEYYGSDIGRPGDKLFRQVRQNVFLVNNHTVNYNGINIICTSLWSFIEPVHQILLQRALTDFSAISRGGERFLPEHFNALHSSSLDFLRKALGDKGKSQNIVVTHHVPTYLNYPSKYRKSPLCQGFATELSECIHHWNIDCWIYGHHHCNVPGFKIADTALLTNQLGRVSKGEHRRFKANATIDTGSIEV
jgi:hypothetical protein